jgi:hypothetical protein
MAGFAPTIHVAAVTVAAISSECVADSVALFNFQVSEISALKSSSCP